MQQPPGGWGPPRHGGPPQYAPPQHGGPQQYAPQPQAGYPPPQHGSPGYPHQGGFGPVEVNASFGWRIGCGFALMLGFAGPFVASGIYGLTEGDDKSITAFAIGLAALVLFGIVPGLNIARRRGTVRRFDAVGITRYDGRALPWSEFQGARREDVRNKYGHTSVFRVDLTFTSGSASIFPATIQNIEQVMPVLDALLMRVNPWQR